MKQLKKYKKKNQTKIKWKWVSALGTSLVQPFILYGSLSNDEDYYVGDACLSLAWQKVLRSMPGIPGTQVEAAWSGVHTSYTVMFKVAQAIEQPVFKNKKTYVSKNYAL